MNASCNTVLQLRGFWNTSPLRPQMQLHSTNSKAHYTRTHSVFNALLFKITSRNFVFCIICSVALSAKYLICQFVSLSVTSYCVTRYA
jgi:hypothetical protein